MLDMPTNHLSALLIDEIEIGEVISITSHSDHDEKMQDIPSIHSLHVSAAITYISLLAKF